MGQSMFPSHHSVSVELDITTHRVLSASYRRLCESGKLCSDTFKTRQAILSIDPFTNFPTPKLIASHNKVWCTVLLIMFPNIKLVNLIPQGVQEPCNAISREHFLQSNVCKKGVVLSFPLLIESYHQKRPQSIATQSLLSLWSCQGMVWS